MPSLINPYAFTEQPGVSLVHTATDLAVNNDTWTLAGVNFGSEALSGLTRHIVLLVTWNDNDVGASVSGLSATIGGVSATGIKALALFGPSDGITGGCGIFIAAVPTGTSGTVVVTLSGFSGTMDAWAMAAYRAVGLASATPTFSDSISNDDEITLAVPSGGFGVAAGGGSRPGAAYSFTGTGAVVAFDGTRAGAGMFTAVSGSTLYTVTGGVASTGVVVAGAAWEFI